MAGRCGPPAGPQVRPGDALRADPGRGGGRRGGGIPGLAGRDGSAGPRGRAANPGSFLLPERGDRAYAAVAAVAAVVAADPTADRWIAGWQVLGQAAATAPDVAAVAARRPGPVPPGRGPAPTRSQAVRPGAARRRAAPRMSRAATWCRGWLRAALGGDPVPVPGHRAVRRSGHGQSRDRHGGSGRAWRMHADPGLTAAWTPAQLGSVLVHHVCHLLRGHGDRAVAAGVTPPTRAAGCAARTPRSTTTWCPRGWTCRAGRSSRSTWARPWPAGRAVLRQPRARPVPMPPPDADLDCGSGADGQGRGPGTAPGDRHCRRGRPSCWPGRWPRTACSTPGARHRCPRACCAGRGRCWSQPSTGGRRSRRSCAGRSLTRPARWTTPTGGPPAARQCPATWCCPRCAGRCPRSRWSATPRAA